MSHEILECRNGYNVASLKPNGLPIDEGRSPSVEVTDGNGSWTISDWRELWGCVWRVVAYAIDFTARGACRCGCEIAECAYCAHECGGTGR